jgi:hypothetical protein
LPIVLEPLTHQPTAMSRCGPRTLRERVASLDELHDPCEGRTEPNSGDSHELELDPTTSALSEAEDGTGADSVRLSGPAARDLDDAVQDVVLVVIGIYRVSLTAIHLKTEHQTIPLWASLKFRPRCAQASPNSESQKI